MCYNTIIFLHKMKKDEMIISEWARMWGVPAWKAQVRLTQLLKDGIVEKTTKYINQRPHEAFGLIYSDRKQRKQRRQEVA